MTRSNLSVFYRSIRHQNIATGLVIALVVMAGLYLVSQANYLLFHTLVEFFSIVIAFTIFVLTWNSRRILNNGYLLVLGISFLFTGGFDLLHTLAFDGMGVFPGTEFTAQNAANLGTQLWLLGRFNQSLSLVIAPFFLRRKFNPWGLLAVYSVAAVLLLMSIFAWNIFPAAYGSHGLTPFKIYSEYVFILLIATGLWLLVRIRAAFDKDVLSLLILALLLKMFSEFFFTQYLAVNDLSNILGHFIKVGAFYLMYKAIIVTGFLKPQDLLYRELAQSEEALRASEARERARSAQLEAIMDVVPAVVWIAHDPQAQVVTGNRVSTELLRMTPNTNLSKSAPDSRPTQHFRVLDRDNRELAPEELPLQVSAATGKPVREFEETILFDDGEERHLFGHVTPLLDENGAPGGAVAAFIDITARVHTEEALQESERRYRTLFESMAEGFSLQEVLFDEQGQAFDYRILEVNPAYEQLVNRPRAELIGKTLRELAPSSPWIERFGEAVRTGRPDRHEDFSLLAGKYVEMLINPMAGPIVASLTIDVTERRRSQEALRQSEARLRRLVESGIIGIIYSDEHGRIPLANDAFLDIVGYSRSDFESGRINLNTLTPPEYQALDAASIDEAYRRGACTPYEKELLRKNGARVPVLIGYAYFRESATPFISFIVDLTEQKTAEAAVKKYAEQLERSNRELEDFAFVASHDLQEPLRKIQAFGERLTARLKEQGAVEDDTRDYLERMMNAAVRMRAMVNDLLSLSRVTTRGRPFQRVVLPEVIGEVISDLEVRIERSGGHVQVELGDVPVIEADEIQLSQLFQNLIGNALKFHKPAVPPQVRVYSQCNREQETVTIYVEDQGIGFDPQYIERIFQPFQRLHGRGEYEGSGIGLAVVRKIVERHSGAITASSSPGDGATFAVTLPVQQPLQESRED